MFDLCEADKVRIVRGGVGCTGQEVQLVSGVPAKLRSYSSYSRHPDRPPPDNPLEFTAAHLGTGLKVGEESLPEDTGNTSPGGGLPELNQAALELVRFQKALLATRNADAEAATGWLFEQYGGSRY